MTARTTFLLTFSPFSVERKALRTTWSEDAQLDAELAELCAEFHKRDPWFRSHDYNIRAVARAKFFSVLTRMLQGKKLSLPFVFKLESILRPSGLEVAVAERTVEGILLAARLRTKCSKAHRGSWWKSCTSPKPSAVRASQDSEGIMRKLQTSVQIPSPAAATKLEIFDLNRATICCEDGSERHAVNEMEV